MGNSEIFWGNGGEKSWCPHMVKSIKDRIADKTTPWPVHRGGLSKMVNCGQCRAVAFVYYNEKEDKYDVNHAAEGQSACGRWLEVLGYVK